MATLPLHLGRLVSWVVRHREGVTWGVMLFPLLFVGFMLAWKVLDPSFYRYLIAENNIVEMATCLAYLLASAAAASLAVDLWRQRHTIFSGLYVVLSAGLFFISMEEISWGQQFIKHSSPEFFQQYNAQGETNFHNLGWFPLHTAFIVVSLYGAFSRLILSGVFKIRDAKLINLLTVPYYLLLFFFIPLVLYVYYEYLYFTQLQPSGLEWDEFFTPEHFIIGKDQEPIELLLGLAFLLFVVVNKYQYRRAGPAARVAHRHAT